MSKEPNMLKTAAQYAAMPAVCGPKVTFWFIVIVHAIIIGMYIYFCVAH